jgi:hypothetical protein
MMRPDPTELAVARCFFAFFTITVAFTVSHVAYEMGFSGEEIRGRALIGAFITGLFLALKYFGHTPRKPK